MKSPGTFPFWSRGMTGSVSVCPASTVKIPGVSKNGGKLIFVSTPGGTDTIGAGSGDDSVITGGTTAGCAGGARNDGTGRSAGT